MKKIKIILSLALICFAAGRNIFAEGADTNSPAWISQPLSLVQCLNLAFQQNASILKAKNDLEAAHGVVVQAGTVPKFNVLRAEVAVANERPILIRAHNDYRIAKNNLSNLIGYNLPRDIWEDVPLNLSDALDDAPYQVNLPDAIQRALSKRTELLALRKTEELQKLNIVSAKSGYKPTVSVFAGYSWYNAQFTAPVTLDHDINGWNAGAQLQWDIFDGLLTRGKVTQAKALHEKSQNELADQSRQIVLQVRTAYSSI